MKVSASILSANYCFLGDFIKELEAQGVDGLHFDIMDGHFVPNLSFGTGMIRHARPLVKMFFDVHLMVTNPDHYLEECLAYGANAITFHPFACAKKVEDCLKYIQNNKAKAGLAISPLEDPLTWPASWFETADSALIMTVQPGFGGQPFISECLSKIQGLKNAFTHLSIGVDGGVQYETAKEAQKAGADYIVCGSYLISPQERAFKIHALKQLWG